MGAKGHQEESDIGLSSINLLGKCDGGFCGWYFLAKWNIVGTIKNILITQLFCNLERITIGDLGK